MGSGVKPRKMTEPETAESSPGFEGTAPAISGGGEGEPRWWRRGTELQRGLATGLICVTLGVVAFLSLKPDPVFVLTRPRQDYRCYYWWTVADTEGLHPREGARLAEERTGRPCYSWGYYPPSLLLLFRPLSVFSESTSQLIFYVLMALAIGVYLGVCGVVSGYPVLGTILFAGWCAPMFQHAANLGQPTAFTALLFGVSLLLLVRGRWMTSGFLMSLSCFLKPLEIGLYVPLALMHDYRALISLTVSGLAVLAVCLVIQGPDLWVEWVRFLPSTAEHRLVLPRHYAMSLAVVLAMAGPGLGASRDGRPEEV